VKHNDTTRKFPRSLSEAYPDVRFAAIEKPVPKDHFAEAYVIVIAAIAVAIYFWIK
jgi:hypothetical protein